MQTFILTVHIFVCILLILVILFQPGKGTNMNSPLVGSTQTIFGSNGSNVFLLKITTIIAFIFMLTSLYIAYSSIVKKEPVSIMQSISSNEIN